MDPKGHLIITDANGKETFRGQSYEETGLVEQFHNRKERRAEAAARRRREKILVREGLARVR